MSTAKIIYKGDLRTVSIHLASGEKITTDAPTDNHGKGEAFSPTDLTATSLGCCMVTVMGLAANGHDIDIRDTELEITKHMLSDPRRIGSIDIVLTMPNKVYSKKDQKILEHAAITCPVAKSLHPDIQQNISFIWVEDKS
ncbi:MAG: OsmC family protein [Saprospiraceae bacterium]